MHHSKGIYFKLTRDAGQLGGLPLWLTFRALPSAIGCALVLLLLWAAPGRAMVPESMGEASLDGVASGQLLLQGGRPGHFIPAVLQASKAHFDISGMIATVSVEQSFRNDTDKWLEGVYAFPLPENAAVRAMEMVIGERRIVGNIREKSVAKKIYRDARAAGKKASLVEQQRPNLFTNRVANIAPGEHVTVRLEYVQQVSFTGEEFSLRFPTTLTPRYVPGQPLQLSEEGDQATVLTVSSYHGWAGSTPEVPDADAISPLQLPQEGDERAPLNPVEITVRLDMGMPLARVDAPYHDITLARRAAVYDIRLTNGVSEMDRDFVLTWQPVSGSAPAAAFFSEEVEGEHYGLLMLLPPASERAAQPLPRELVFVVDTSGSMGGVAIEQARDSVSRALQELRPEDRFNIVAFNSNHHSLFRRSVPATRHHLEQAREFVRQLRAGGGTEMLPALRAALGNQEVSDGLQEQLPLRQVIFITDGAVGNEVALFEEISTLLGESRLFTVGIGAAPNSWFMREAARYGRGSHTHIGGLNEVGEKMAALFSQLSRPAAVNLSVSWPAPVEAWPERMQDLYLGQPLLVAVSFGTVFPQGEVVVRGTLAGQPWQQRLQLDTGADPVRRAQHTGVASLWAREKIAGLLDQQILGRSEESVRAAVLPVALRHRLLSPYTSFVAVEEVISRPAGETAGSGPMPNTRPQGQAPQHFAYPRTATTGPAKAWLGTMFLFLATMLWVMRQPEVDHVPVVAD